MNERKLFIDAYAWMFGESEAKANETYRLADEEYVKELIRSYIEACSLMFLND